MKKECCDVQVTEIENGYRIEVTGDDVKEKCKSVIENCKSVIENCCGEEAKKKCFDACCK